MGDRKQPNPPPSETGAQQVKPDPPPSPPRKRQEYPGMMPNGISLRDYAAIHLLAAMVASARLDGIHLEQPELEARTAYEWADAVIAAREA